MPLDSRLESFSEKASEGSVDLSVTNKPAEGEFELVGETYNLLKKLTRENPK